MPDSRERWEAIWAHRDAIAVVAHSHPNGPAAFSAEDESTMAAIDAALGRSLRYAVVTADTITYRGLGADRADDPDWATRMRDESGMV
jgi:Prokaryotic homologs of the JAB domain